MAGDGRTVGTPHPDLRASSARCWWAPEAVRDTCLGALLGLFIVGCSIESPEGIVGVYVPGPGSSGLEPMEPPSYADAGPTGGATDAAPQVTDAGAIPMAPDNGCSLATSALCAVVRDFKQYDVDDPTSHPDFDFTSRSADDLDIVADVLGFDRKPVYKDPLGMTETTHGPAAFDQWYRDVPGTNLRIPYPLPLASDGNGMYRYAGTEGGASGNCDAAFFPIDDGDPYQTPFGNQGFEHNFAFTLELHATFTYNGGEVFEICGDDDVFVFINKRLVVNLGGFHFPRGTDLRLDDLGLTPGNDYPLDVFYAERHRSGAVFGFTTDLELFSVIVP